MLLTRATTRFVSTVIYSLVVPVRGRHLLNLQEQRACIDLR